MFKIGSIRSTARRRCNGRSAAATTRGIVNITLDEFKAAVAYATERLRSLRGKLDLHNGREAVGDKTNRACLIPVQVPCALRPTGGPPEVLLAGHSRAG